MKISRFKKYITWNIVSALGYFSAVFSMVFWVIYFIASSGTHIRADINEIFYTYIINHIISPYIEFNKFQLTLILVLITLSVYENRYNIIKNRYGLRLFSNYEREYTIAFSTGLVLNFVPMYTFSIFLVSQILTYIR